MTPDDSQGDLSLATIVALLRAINVGGHAVVKMDDLRAAFTAAGCKEVRTFIASGNVLFEAPSRGTAALFTRIRAKLKALLGEEPGIAFRSAQELDALVAAAPFKRYLKDPRIKVYVAFLSKRPSKQPTFPLRWPAEAMEAIGMHPLDVFLVSRRKPNGMYGFPNLFIERDFGVPATTRNWNTVTKIAALLEE